MNSVRSVDIFQSAKQISTLDIIHKYLPEVDLRKRGSRWVARCPFHEDSKPSFYVFPDGGTKCFGCGWYGDSVALVARALGVRPIEAARAICREFGLPVPGDNPSPGTRRRALKLERDQQLERSFRKWVNDTYLGLCVIYRALGRVLMREGYWKYPYLAQLEPYLEYLLDILQYGPVDMQIQLYKSRQLEGFQWQPK